MNIPLFKKKVKNTKKLIAVLLAVILTMQAILPNMTVWATETHKTTMDMTKSAKPCEAFNSIILSSGKVKKDSGTGAMQSAFSLDMDFNMKYLSDCVEESLSNGTPLVPISFSSTFDSSQVNLPNGSIAKEELKSNGKTLGAWSLISGEDGVTLSLDFLPDVYTEGTTKAGVKFSFNLSDTAEENSDVWLTPGESFDVSVTFNQDPDKLPPETPEYELSKTAPAQVVSTSIKYTLKAESIDSGKGNDAHLDEKWIIDPIPQGLKIKSVYLNDESTKPLTCEEDITNTTNGSAYSVTSNGGSDYFVYQISDNSGAVTDHRNELIKEVLIEDFDVATPDSAIPDSDLGDTDLPDDNVPDIDTPDSTVPDIDTPDSFPPADDTEIQSPSDLLHVNMTETQFSNGSDHILTGSAEPTEKQADIPTESENQLPQENPLKEKEGSSSPTENTDKPLTAEAAPAYIKKAAESITVTIVMELTDELYNNYLSAENWTQTFKNQAYIAESATTPPETSLGQSPETSTTMKLPAFFTKNGSYSSGSSCGWELKLHSENLSGNVTSAYIVDWISDSETEHRYDFSKGFTWTSGTASGIISNWSEITDKEISQTKPTDLNTPEMLSKLKGLATATDTIYYYPIKIDDVNYTVTIIPVTDKLSDTQPLTITYNTNLVKSDQTDTDLDGSKTLKNSAQFVYELAPASGSGDGSWNHSAQLDKTQTVHYNLMNKTTGDYNQKSQIMNWMFDINQYGMEAQSIYIEDTLNIADQLFLLANTDSIALTGSGTQTQLQYNSNVNQSSDTESGYFLTTSDTKGDVTLKIRICNIAAADRYAFIIQTHVVNPELLATSNDAEKKAVTNTASYQVYDANHTPMFQEVIEKTAMKEIKTTLVQKIPISFEENNSSGSTYLYDYANNLIKWKVTVNPDHVNIRYPFGSDHSFLEDVLPTGVTFDKLTAFSFSPQSPPETAVGCTIDSGSNTITFPDTYLPPIAYEAVPDTRADNTKPYSAQKLLFRFPSTVTTTDSFTLEFTTHVDDAYRLEQFVSGVDSAGNLGKLKNSVNLYGSVVATAVPAEKVQQFTAQATAVNTTPVAPNTKSGTYYSNKDYPLYGKLHYIHWEAVINRTKANMGGIQVKDQLKEYMQLIPESVHFYQVTLDQKTGAVPMKADQTIDGSDVTDQINADLSFDQITLTIPDALATQTLVMAFDTALTDTAAGAAMTNSLSFSGAGHEDGTTDNKADQTADFDFDSYINSAPIAYIQITKTGSQTESDQKTPLKDVIFTVTEMEAAPDASGNYASIANSSTVRSTNAKGLCTFMLLKRNTLYKIEETSAPVGYEKSDDIYCIFTDDGTKYPDTINGSGLYKTIANSNSAAGFKYSVNNVLAQDTLTIQKLKEVVSTSLTGDVPIAGEGFWFHVAGNALDGAAINTYMKAEQIQAKSIIIKEDGIYVQSGSDGSIVFSNLRAGSYTVTEYADPNSSILAEYQIDTVPKEVIMAMDEQTGHTKPVLLTITNHLKRGSITGMKNRADNQPLGNAAIGLFPDNTPKEQLTAQNLYANATVKSQDTDPVKGQFLFQSIPYGTYLLAELEAPDGYLKNTETVYRITLDEDNPLVTAGNLLTWNSQTNGWEETDSKKGLALNIVNEIDPSYSHGGGSSGGSGGSGGPKPGGTADTNALGPGNLPPVPEPPVTPVYPPFHPEGNYPLAPSQPKADGSTTVTVPNLPPHTAVDIINSKDILVYHGQTDENNQVNVVLPPDQYMLVAIDDQGVPLAQMLFTIEDRDVPLGTLPKTGDTGLPVALLIIILLGTLAVYTIIIIDCQDSPPLIRKRKRRIRQ